MKRRAGAALVPILVGISVLSLIFVAKKAPKIPPEKQLTILRMQIVQCARDIEAAYQAGRITEAQYRGSKVGVTEALDTYNVVVEHYYANKVIPKGDVARIMAVLNVAMACVPKKPSGGVR